MILSRRRRYQLRSFYRKNQTGLAAAGLVAVGLMLGAWLRGSMVGFRLLGAVPVEGGILTGTGIHRRVKGTRLFIGIPWVGEFFVSLGAYQGFGWTVDYKAYVVQGGAGLDVIFLRGWIAFGWVR
jgi:hypothetical protein